MKMAGTAWVVVILLLTVGLGLFWYWEGENFSDGAVCGTYTLRQNGEAVTLVLTPDHRFQQELESGGTVRRAEGSWHVFGEGGIGFSEELLKVTGQEMGPSGRPYGQIRNRFGMVSITLAPNPDGGPRLRKKLFRRATNPSNPGNPGDGILGTGILGTESWGQTGILGTDGTFPDILQRQYPWSYRNG